MSGLAKLLRKVMWCFNCGGKRKRFEFLYQQSYEIEKKDCNSDVAFEWLRQWETAVANLLSGNKDLLDQLRRLSFMPRAGVVIEGVDVSFEWNHQDWEKARKILVDFALGNGGSQES